MPDLLFHSPATLTHPPSATSPVPILKALNPLYGPKDGAFLTRPDHLAGRHVCIVLYATSDSREERLRAWQDQVRDGVNLSDLGRAAKMIEDAGFNWRELENHDEVLEAAETLRAPGATH